MYRKILVPTDGSPASNRALDHAAALARQTGEGATIALLLVADPRELRALGTLPRTERTEQAMRTMEKALLEADEELLARAADRVRAKGVPVTTRRIEGGAAAVIDRESREGGYDLIVMGSRGLGLTDEAANFLGSVTERVLRRVACPVLVVKETPRDSGDAAGEE